jgi:hypothetical protein
VSDHERCKSIAAPGSMQIRMAPSLELVARAVHWLGLRGDAALKQEGQGEMLKASLQLYNSSLFLFFWMLNSMSWMDMEEDHVSSLGLSGYQIAKSLGVAYRTYQARRSRLGVHKGREGIGFGGHRTCAHGCS